MTKPSPIKTPETPEKRKHKTEAVTYQGLKADVKITTGNNQSHISSVVKRRYRQTEPMTFAGLVICNHRRIERKSAMLIQNNHRILEYSIQDGCVASRGHLHDLQ